MDIIQLNNYLQGDYDKISEILNQTGFHSISINQNKREIRCARDYGRNNTSVKINIDTLYSKCYSTNTRGNLITLIQRRNNWTFKNTLVKIASILDIDEIKLQSIQLPFGGYYKGLFTNNKLNYMGLPTYNEEILNDYYIKPSLIFYQDGIDYNVQHKYQIGYDRETERITVAWRDCNGDIIGIMGRYNSLNVPKEVSKWLPIIPFSKSYTLFGFSENYINLIEQDCVIISESEKAPMQLESKGINYGIGLGGSYINPPQINFIKSLNIKNTILSYDEGLEEEFIREQAKKLIMKTPFIQNRVGYIFDTNYEILERGKKQSPSDLGIGDLNYLLKNNVRWMN
jgi:DNA primase